jgi:hypothetical protein
MAPYLGHENSMTRDFEDFNTPLKDAPIVSLRALEDGDDDFDAEDGAISFWRRLVMTLRARPRRIDAGRRRVPDEDPSTPLYHDTVVRRSNKVKWRRRSCWSCIAIPILILVFL